MKENTTIICPKCNNTLQKEPWGMDSKGQGEWRFTCNKCGFEDVIVDALMLACISVNKLIYLK